MDTYPSQTFSQTRTAARMAVVGAGSIGCFVADAASQAGNFVTLCVRTPVDQVTVESGGVRWISQVKIVSDPAAAEAVDWVFVATKTQDTVGTAAWMNRLVGPQTKVVLLQNGIDGEGLIRPLIGKAPLIPSIVYIASERRAPGRIVHFFGRKIEVPQGDLSAELAGLMGGALDVVQQPDFVTAAWRKLIYNAVLNPITAMTLRRFEVFSAPRIRELAIGLIREGVAVGNAAGAHFADEDVRDITEYVCHLSPQSGTSMLYDRIAGRALEYEHITGTVVRLARRYGVAAPLNEAIYALLTAVDGARSLHEKEAVQSADTAVAAA